MMGSGAAEGAGAVYERLAANGATPVIKVHARVAGVAAPTQDGLGRELIEDQEIVVAGRDGSFELELLVPAFGVRLIDIPVTPLP